MAIDDGRKIVIDYKPRPFWKNELHPALEQYRFSVVVCHRRFGKTVGCVNHMIKQALLNTRESPKYAYIAPFLKQAKLIAWEYLKRYTRAIPDIRINESELWIELPTRHEGLPGAKLYIFGADRPDALRGLYLDGVVMDEYAQMRKEMWGEVIRPLLSDRGGWAVFIGTPKGQNAFYDKYLEACKEPDWFACLHTCDETGVIPEDELLSMKKDMTETEIRQELYCDFAASAYDRLISLDLVNAAMEKEPVPEKELKDVPRVMGVDVARFGDDRSVIFRRCGLQAYEPLIFDDIDNMTLVGNITHVMDEWNPEFVFIDSGRGEGVIDRLRQLGYGDRIIEVPFGGKPIKDTRYMNKRAEMWDECRIWLTQGGHLPYLPDLRKELTTPTYTFDGMNRIKLESKESMKDKTGNSPDMADALCLTFAFPVNMSRNMQYRRARKKGNVHRFGCL